MVFSAQWVCTHRCSRLGEADNGELAGDVNRRAGKADVPADGGIIDDAPPPDRSMAGISCFIDSNTPRMLISQT